MTLDIAVRHTQGDFTLDTKFTCGDGITALFGRSGDGKTTLVNLIAGLARTNSAGRIDIDGPLPVDTASCNFDTPLRRPLGDTIRHTSRSETRMKEVQQCRGCV